MIRQVLPPWILIKSITKIGYKSEKEKENQHNLRFIAINSAQNLRRLIYNYKKHLEGSQVSPLN